LKEQQKARAPAAVAAASSLPREGKKKRLKKGELKEVAAASNNCSLLPPLSPSQK